MNEARKIESLENTSLIDSNVVIDYEAVMSRILSSMKILGLRGFDITNALGMSQSSFSLWRRGKSYSFINHLDRIADALGVPVDFLLNNMEDSSSDAEQLFRRLDENILSSKNVAKMLNISPSSVYSWRAKKAIPPKHIDSIQFILNSTSTPAYSAPDNHSKEGIFQALKQKSISKASLAIHLGISKATVYSWKEDSAISDKHIGIIQALLQQEPEAEEQDAAPSIEISQDDGTLLTDDVTAFIDNIRLYIEDEIRRLSDDERKSCLLELDSTILLALKRIKVYTKASIALGI